MKRFVLLAGTFLFLSGAAFAGGGDFNEYPQQQVPQIKINVPSPTPDDSNSWAVPIAVAVITTLGGVVVAYITTRNRKKD